MSVFLPPPVAVESGPWCFFSVGTVAYFSVGAFSIRRGIFSIVGLSSEVKVLI